MKEAVVALRADRVLHHRVRGETGDDPVDVTGGVT